MSFDPLFFLAIGLSYLLGCVPTGLWLGQSLRGVDIREHGSRNIGATNTLRVLGKQLGAAALAGDVLKGVVAVLAFGRLASAEHLPLACGAAAIAGHVFSVFVRFKGGKGVATSAGVFLALAPVPTLITAGVFLAVALTTRMVSAASITGAAVLAVLVWVFPHTLPLRVIAAALALLVIVRHRANIQRILAGNENRF